MPFVRWETYQECTIEQQQLGHDEESANRICGDIQNRAEKGMLLKSIQNINIINKQGTDLIVGGYASWELRDPQNDIITTQAQVKFLHKLFKEPECFRNIMLKHSNFQIATPLLSYTSPSNEKFYSHVNEIGTYLISKIRDNGWRSVEKARERILKGELAMYSISGDPINWEVKNEHGENVRYIYDIDPWEVTLCEKGVNPKAHVQVLSKAEKLCKPCVEKWTVYYIEKGKSHEEAKRMAEKLVIRKYVQPTKQKSIAKKVPVSNEYEQIFTKNWKKYLGDGN